MIPKELLQRLTLPDEWQAQAIRALGAGRDVVVQAPTGAGKTFVFEQFYQQARPGRQTVYTVPTRALANDKYAEWRRRGWRVGITTGDVTVEPGAPLVVATLEAQQRPADAALYVVDEYQWLGDALRGNHYEGVLMTLPASTRLLLLSGSVANPAAVAEWLGRLGRHAEIVEQHRRPVPLEEVDLRNVGRAAPKSIEGFWARGLAGALREDLGPVLVFAPARKQAEKIAREVAAQIPCPQPMALTPEQEEAAGPKLARLLTQRVAYHHSGLSYVQRAGLVEPLAKGGQLRVVVATLGLSAGINFSLRSVLVTGTSYQAGGLPREVTPAELLQMFGRAGRRGLDDHGYVLVTDRTPRLGQSARQPLRRAAPLPWRPLLQELGEGVPLAEAAERFQHRLFTTEAPALGAEDTLALGEDLPCHLHTDTGRARLVRRELVPERKPAKPGRGKDKAPPPSPGFCAPCPWKDRCLALDPAPTLLWTWNRIGLLDRAMGLTRRGRVMTHFIGPEGLGVIAGLEDARYPVEELRDDLANLFATDRFSGAEPRYGGRLARACAKAYRRFGAEGFLHDGVPVNYGDGGGEVVRTLRAIRYVPPEVLGEHASRGDVDRLLIEWRSLLRQILAVAVPEGALAEPDHAAAMDEAEAAAAEAAPAKKRRGRRREGRTESISDAAFWQRLAELQAACRDELAHNPQDSLPDLPPLTAEQLKPVSHRLVGR